MRFSLRFNNDTEPSEFVALAHAAEGAGFDQVWVSHDLFLHAAPVLLTMAAGATERIGLGTGILNPYSASPAELAMTATTLQAATGGRFLLGLGAGAADFLGWAGIARREPLSRTREAVHAIRALLSGGRPADDARAGQGWQPEALMRVRAAEVPPIYLGVMGPKMTAMAGEVADGVLPLLFPPEHFPTADEQVAAGIRQAGRTAGDVDVAACVWVSIDDDADRARHALAEKIAYFGPSFSPYLLGRAGITVDDFAPISHAVRTDGITAAARLVTPAMLRLGIAGGPDEVVRRGRWLVDHGARHVSFGPPLGPDPLAAVQLLGSTVLPALREKVPSRPLPPAGSAA